MSRPDGWAGHALRALFTGALLALVVGLGQIPFGRPSDSAALRLALRTARGRVEVCRDRSAEELAALPVHMRQERVCETRAASYRLVVRLDGRTVLEGEARARGVRGDRPLTIDRQVEVPAGPALLEVVLEPRLDAETESLSAAVLAKLPRYRLSQSVELTAGRITLVLLDEATGELLLHTGRHS